MLCKNNKKGLIKMSEQILEKKTNEQSNQKLKQKIIAVIPAYNEEKYIQKVIEETKKYVDDVIVVDDASKDKTNQLARQAGAIVLRHEVNLAKGGALKTGCDAAIQLGADVIVTLDGDGQHDPNEIPKLIKGLEEHELIIGARKFNENMPMQSKIGNITLSKFSKMLFHTNISDTQTGFRAFKSSAYSKILWESTGYEVETEMIKNINKNKVDFSEVEVKTIYNDNYKGTTPMDGAKIALNMIKWRAKQ